jgi:outer membrane protein assembly factor BamB
VIYGDRVYFAVGQSPEHGEGIGRLWCIDPRRTGDISPELAVNRANPNEPVPRRRLQAVDAEKGEAAVPNPNSGVVWQYHGLDAGVFEETMHRSCSTVVIQDDLLYVTDFSGLMHCVDAVTGKAYWTHDLFAACWGSPLLVDGKVYIGDEEGKVAIFKHGKKKQILSAMDVGNSIYATLITADDVLYIAAKTHLIAIGPDEEPRK